MGGLSAMFLLSFLQYTSSNFRFALCVHRFLNSILDPCCHSFFQFWSRKYFPGGAPFNADAVANRTAQVKVFNEQLQEKTNIVNMEKYPQENLSSSERKRNTTWRTNTQNSDSDETILLIYSSTLPHGSIRFNPQQHSHKNYLPCHYKMVDLEVRLSVKQYREIWIRTIM